MFNSLDGVGMIILAVLKFLNISGVWDLLIVLLAGYLTAIITGGYVGEDAGYSFGLVLVFYLGVNLVKNVLVDCIT